MKDFQYITSQHPAFIESMYQDFLKNPDSVDPEFKMFFAGFDFANSSTPAKGKSAAFSSSPSTATVEEKPTVIPKEPVPIDWMREIQAYRLILGYRNKGHLLAKTNPIRTRKDRGANIGLPFFGFTDADLDKDFHAGNLIGLVFASR